MQNDPRASRLERVEPVPNAEVVAALAAAICGRKPGTMTREAEVFLARVCAEVLFERMALAG